MVTKKISSKKSYQEYYLATSGKQLNNIDFLMLSPLRKVFFCHKDTKAQKYTKDKELEINPL